MFTQRNAMHIHSSLEFKPFPKMIVMNHNAEGKKTATVSY